MGRQCAIFLTYYTEKSSEELEIRKVLGRDTLEEQTKIDAIGNRAFSIGLKYEMICMKYWGKPECITFIDRLRKEVNWQYPETVQVYYAPEVEPEENYSNFTLVKLFPFPHDLKPLNYFEIIAPTIRIGIG